MKSENKICQNCKKGFVIESDDFGFYKDMKVPAPTWCSECRAMRRLIWRNERSLYHNKCAFSGKNIISMFAPEKKLTVYDHNIWWSDKWDPLSYGQEYDFSKSFFTQFQELMSRVPLANLGNINCLNSEYGNHNTDCRNCYLVYACYKGENLFYSKGTVEVKDSFDVYTTMDSEHCYEAILGDGLYKTHFSYAGENCINSSFITTSNDLQNCLACINLRHKSHCIFNYQYSKEDYDKKISTYDFGSYKELTKFKEEYDNFLKNQFRRFALTYKSVNVTGDDIEHSKNSKFIFGIFGDVEDSKYITHAMDLKNSYDVYGVGKAEYVYESVDAAINTSRNCFAVLTHGCFQTNYTYMCHSSDNLFGCIGLRKQKYCILNKKYTKEEYNELLPKIIDQMNTMPYIDKKGRVYTYGEFFPLELSPFAYNETIAGEYYTLTEKQANDFGFRWKEKEKRNYQIEVKSEDLPDHVKDVDESIVGKVIGCMHGGSCNEQCTEAFKILPEELQFYKKNNLAIPRLCPNCRHFQRLKKRNPLKLWHRICMCDKQNHSHGKGKCEVEFETSYAPDRPEIVYCEKCYQQEVY